MTVQDVLPSVSYVANGAQTSFVYNFRTNDPTWIGVNFTDDLSGINVNIDQDNNPGGTVEYNVAPPNGTDLIISRQSPVTQVLDYTRYDPFDSTSHENALDKLTMIIQELTARVDGTIDGIISTIDSLWQFTDVAGDRTLQIVDKSKMLRCTAIDPTVQLITVPQDSNIDHQLGTQISVYRKGTAVVDWIGEGGVVVNSAGLSSIARVNGTVTFIKEGPDEWLVVGEIAENP